MEYRPYKDYIETLRRRYVGKRAQYAGAEYTIVSVDYNGFLLINKPGRYTATTAVDPCNVTVIERS